MKDQAEALRTLVRNKQSKLTTRTIAVASGKGGVGKSNLAANLALALIQQNQKVALLDADLGLANIDLILGITPFYTLTHVLKGEKKFTDIFFSGPLGLQVLPGGSGVYELANLNQIHLDELVTSLDYIDKKFDFIIIDTGAGINRTVLNFVLAADEILVVTTPDPASITDAYGLIKTIFKEEPDVYIKVVVNLAQSPSQAESVWQRLEMVVKEFLQKKIEYGGYILSDLRVKQSVSQQKPVLLSYPNSSASRCIEKIALDVLEASCDNDKRGLKSLFSKLFQLSTPKR